MKISFGNMTVELNIFDINKQPLDYDEVHPKRLKRSLMRSKMSLAWRILRWNVLLKMTMT
jgi:hypothetical protein